MNFTTGCFIAMLTASAADMATTVAATNAGAVEQNPWFSRPGVLMTEKAAIGTLQFVALKHWEKQHPTMVRVIAIGSASFYATLAAHNLQVYRQMNGRR